MDYRKYIALLRHWLWLTVLSALLAGGIAYVVSQSRTEVFSSSARYYVQSAPGANVNAYTQGLVERSRAQNFAELMVTSVVLQGVVDKLSLNQQLDAYRLRNNISVSVQDDSQIIRVTVRDTKPERAAVIANTVGEVFGEWNDAQQDERFITKIQEVESSLQTINQERQNVEQKIIALGDPQTNAEDVQLTQLRLELNEAQERYQSQFNILTELEVDRTSSKDSIIAVEQAVRPSVPISPRVSSNTLLATILGGLLAIGAVIGLDILDDTVKTPDEVEADTALSTLANIGFIKGEQPQDRLITYHQPRAPISEAYRVLRTNMSFAAVDKEIRSLLVTSSSPGEGKSTTSANLAVVLAQTGKRVVIVDADLRRPSQHKIHAVTNNQGLTTALLDSHTPVMAHLQETQTPGLRIMSSGPLPPNPAELLNSQRMLDVIIELQEDVDIVLVDTPPVLTVADGAILAPRVDGCILVAEVGGTKREALVESATRMRATGANMFGIVLNRSKAGRGGYYQYYYTNRYYSYEYSAAPEQEKSKGIFGRLVRNS